MINTHTPLTKATLLPLRKRVVQMRSKAGVENLTDATDATVDADACF
jgi:hypothetical protein